MISSLLKGLLKYRRIFILFVNIFLVIAAFYGAFLLRFEFDIPEEYMQVFWSRLPFLLIIKIIVFAYFGLYSGLWRFVSASDIWSIVKANSVASTIFLLVEVSYL